MLIMVMVDFLRLRMFLETRTKYLVSHVLVPLGSRYLAGPVAGQQEFVGHGA
jgi:hypothetical protein